MTSRNDRMTSTGLKAVILRSCHRMAHTPVFWFAALFIPLFSFLLLTTLMEEGLPEKVPAAIVDNDHSDLSRTVSRNLANMQMVEIVSADESFSSARRKMQAGEVFGYFLIPENFKQDLLAGRAPSINFYINMAYYVPASLLLKTFKTTAIYTKAGIVLNIADATGLVDSRQAAGLMMPVNIVTRPLHNPQLNYGIYLCNSFMPCVLQLMIMLMTAFTLGQEQKYGTSIALMKAARGRITTAIFGEILPQTIVWIVLAVFMTSWLYKWNGYPMNGSFGWLLLSEILFVLACQAFSIFIYGILPNLRLSLSTCALTGILSFSLAAFSFPVESMYTAMGIFSWILPIRYNFLIYIDQALNGIDIYYSKIWYLAYLAFMVLPLLVLPRIRKAFCRPVYVP